MVSISPALVSTTEGGHAEFNCLATGVGLGDFEYQWSFNNSLIPSQNTSTLIINNITHGDDGNYACSVRNPYEGIGHSGVARLMILGTYRYLYIATCMVVENNCIAMQWDTFERKVRDCL